MADLIKIAIDAMGGDDSPKKIIDGIIHNHKHNKENFFRTLTKSIGRQDFQQLNKLSQSKEVTHIFLLDADLPKNSEQLMHVNIVSFPSITEICSSRENKEKFLVSLYKLNL